MNNITNTLQPNQRALLYTALLFFKNENERQLSAAMFANDFSMSTECNSYLVTETRLLMDQIFGDCFPEDLEIIQHFNQYWKDLHNIKLIEKAA